jgi:hypothetical protein
VALFGSLLEIDREATVAAYAAIPVWGWTGGCQCWACRNFRALVEAGRFPAEFLALLERLGIDLLKPAENYGFANTDSYGGFYHFVGRFLKGPHPSLHDRTYRVRLAEDFYAEINGKLTMVPPHFPAPQLQLEFSATLPWLLGEKPTDLTPPRHGG